MKLWKLVPLVLLSLSSWVQAAPALDLRRVMVGNQAGLLKVLTPARKIAYTRGIDDRSLARMDESGRSALFQALGLPESGMARSAENLMRAYASSPKKEAVAVLSAVGSSPKLDDATQEKIESFMLGVVAREKDIAARRQAILALAVMPDPGLEVTEKMVAHFEKTDNLWETFPVQQFFEYHASEIRQFSQFPALRARLSKVHSLYTPAILGYLDTPEEKTAAK